MRVCVVYDCLYPHTVGGAELWYRNLAERLAQTGHEVTFVTLRQWERGAAPDAPAGVSVVAVGPRLALYTEGGRRRILPPLAFGLGVLVHLLARRRRYDVVHTASFPYFSVLAAGLVRPWASFALVVDWHEVWSADYWREYLGRLGGEIGHAVQRLCARIPQRAFCFSRLHAARLRSEGLRGEVVVLQGEYRGPTAAPQPASAAVAEPVVVFAARLIPEKRVLLAVAAVAAAARTLKDLRGEFYGDGPERAALAAAIAASGLGERLTAPGFVAAQTIDAALSRALCMLLPSRREGYGVIVVEAAARATPSIVVAAPDNAAVELIEEGVNGFVVADPDPDAIAAAIARVHEQGPALRESTARWFQANAQRLSLESSLRTVVAAYERPSH